MTRSTPCPHCEGTGILREKAMDAAHRQGLVIRYRDIPEYLRAAPPQTRRCAALNLSTRTTRYGRSLLQQCRQPPVEGAEFCAEDGALLMRQMAQRAAGNTAA